MGSFYSAGRDPLQLSHHSNVDRMWEIWKSLRGKNETGFADTDWLNASFLFYDENTDLVRIKVRDLLDTKKLGYVYQEVELPWLKTKPTPRKLVKNKLASVKVTPKSTFPLVLDKEVKSVVVSRPKPSRSRKEKEEEEEVLVIDGIEYDSSKFLKFDVYVNDEYDEFSSGPDKTEFAGSFVDLPHRSHKHGKTRLKLAISKLLEELGADDDDKVLVSLVPKKVKSPVSVADIKIEFLRG